MSDQGINAAYKEKWAAAVAEHGSPLPREVVQRLQEGMRMEWMTHIKGRLKVKPDDEQEAEGTEEEDPGTPDDGEDGERGEVESELAPPATLETTRRKTRGRAKPAGAAKRARSTAKEKRKPRT